MKTKSLFFVSMFVGCSLGEATVITGDSINFGWQNQVVDGANSIAVGAENTVDFRSMGLGWLNNASNNSFALGLGNVTSNYSVAFGRNNFQSNDSAYSIINGYNNTIGTAGQYSAVFGYGNVLQGQDGSFIAGIQNNMLFPSTKDGLGNIILGEYNTLDLVNSASTYARSTVLIGYENSSSENMAYAIGIGNIGQKETVTLGKYAATVSNASLIVGNGSGSSSRNSALIVYKNGDVTISNGNLILGNQPALTSSSAVTAGFVKKDSSITQLGLGASASFAGSIAIGNLTIAGALNSSALGNTAQASGVSSTAIGAGSTALGQDSIAQAAGLAQGQASIAIKGESSGTSSVSIGGYDVAYNNGRGNKATGENSAAIGGVGSLASGYSSFSSGFWTSAQSAYSVALGSMNVGNYTSATSWVENDPLLELGNGIDSRTQSGPVINKRSNAITTLKNGQTTLTNKAWKANPNVAGSTSNSNGQALVVEGHAEVKGNTTLDGNTTLKGVVVLEQVQGDISMGVYQ